MAWTIYIQCIHGTLCRKRSNTRVGPLPPKWACFPNVPCVLALKFGSFKLGIQMFPEHLCLRLPNLGAHAWWAAACTPLFTTHSSYQIIHCTNLGFFNGKINFRKEYHCNKMKENGWVVGVLWEFQPFSHGNHHIRVNMQHVYLLQSISARKATHIKLGTCSGSSQCQLHFGTKMSMDESAVSGSLLNAKMRIFRHFLRWPPLIKYTVFYAGMSSNTLYFAGILSNSHTRLHTVMRYI